VRATLHAEWTKLRTVAGNGWLLAAAAALTVALSAVAIVAVRYAPTGGRVDTTRLSLAGVDLGQALIAIFAVTTIAGEYGASTMVRVTLAATPRRTKVLAAKAILVCFLSVAAGGAAVLGCLLLGRIVLPSRGFAAPHGYQLLSLAHGATLRAAAGCVIYLALIALLSLGIATAVRDAAAAIVLVLGLLYVFPIIAALAPDPTWQRHLQQIGPMTAGLSIQATTGISSVPIGPWAGLGVLAAWAAAALVIGGLLLWVRDA
jgi:ABC-2 type transport system permease protein